MIAAAFFDVDETLITVKSIFRFLAFHLDAAGRPPEEYRTARERIRRMAAAGVPRSVSLGEYFRLFEGERESVLAEHGRRWFAAALAAGGLFHAPVLERFRRHAAAGDRTVLVSGSFPPCLDPLVAHLGADAVLCSRPAIVAGRYTGTVARPMIGAAKAEAVTAEAVTCGIDLADCAAYGDHISDLPVLELVGSPVVVGDDPVLVAHARQRGWQRLAAGRTRPASAVRPGGAPRVDQPVGHRLVDRVDTGDGAELAEDVP